MNIMSMMSILAFGLSLLINYKVSQGLSRTSINKIVRLIGILISWWAFCLSQFYIADTKNIAWFWHKASSISWISIIPASSLYFIFLAGRKNVLSRFTNKIFFIVFPLIMLLYTLFSDKSPIANDLVLSTGGFGWTCINNITSIWLWLYIFMIISYFSITFRILLKSKELSQYKSKRMLSFNYILLDSLLLLIGVITDVIMPLFSSYFVPVANITMILFIFVSMYLVKLYEELNIERLISTEVIFNTSTAAFVVIDKSGKIYYSNENACKIFNTTVDEIENLDYKSFIIQDEEYINLVTNLSKSKIKKFCNKIIRVIIDETEYSLMVSMD